MKKNAPTKWLVLILAIGTLILPFDLIPDTIPVIGWLDDIASIILVFKELLGYIRQRQDASKLIRK